jgi:hypothetical protein
MAKQKRVPVPGEAPPAAPPEPPSAPAAAPNRCRGCGVGLPGHAARWCVACWRARAKPCPTCTYGGEVRQEFRGHRTKGQRVGGKECPTCRGKRYVFDESLTSVS